MIYFQSYKTKSVAIFCTQGYCYGVSKKFVSSDAGAGGGYNEREGVEYIVREESDDEFDDVSMM